MKVTLKVEDIIRQMGISYETFFLYNELDKELSEKEKERKDGKEDDEQR
ncbi:MULTISPECIES: hypothetical protein [Paenibacillus]|nr:hypothetical protein [Paenibacillus caseinilyticus]MCZ8522315.1 hypothetical protein [Paenibacillus caseinilyticus]